ncbi:probable serine/threonine-protein kinase PBL11 [Cryptomeria japonica]|uniref:probable serine/threonine-protein kinase PBL11 n=1 Tax=Cryptomeria japonica TaxID=3369 RepID=UPI0027DA640E|nr:probable serine/threonine-protein kinase PBL11 [Cryptomeria japonica]
MCKIWSELSHDTTYQRENCSLKVSAENLVNSSSLCAFCSSVWSVSKVVIAPDYVSLQSLCVCGSAQLEDFVSFHTDILLDENLNAKISDFGFAQIQLPGYAAPEYLATGRASLKSDIYGFGVTAWRLHDKRRLTQLIDPRLFNAGHLTRSKSISGTINIALQCIGSNARSRPSASRMLEMLLSKDPNRHNSSQR